MEAAEVAAAEVAAAAGSEPYSHHRPYWLHHLRNLRLAAAEAVVVVSLSDTNR